MTNSRGRKISETLTRKAAARRALRPVCLCFCGCGKPLPPRVAKSVIYLRGHQPQADRTTPEYRAKASLGQKRKWENGYVEDESTKRKRVESVKRTRTERKAAGKIYTTRGSDGRLRGFKWAPEIVEKRAAALRKPKTSPRQAKGPAHHKAIHGLLRSAENKTYRFENMSDFVRNHEHLFDVDDVQWNKRFHCRALKGLLSLTAKGNNTRGSWKGWTLVSFTETFYNRGESLLSGESSFQTNTLITHPYQGK